MVIKKVFLLTILCLFLTGCHSSDVPKPLEGSSRFEIIEQANNFNDNFHIVYIVRDKETGVLYFAYADGGTMKLKITTPVLDSFGHPIIKK